MYKNCKISRRNVFNDSISKGPTTCLEYVDISASKLKIKSQKRNTKADIGLQVSGRTTRFSEYNSGSFQRGYEEYKTIIQRDSRGAFRNGLGIREAHRLFIIQMSSPSSIQDFVVTTNSRNDLKIFCRREVKSIKTGNRVIGNWWKSQ